MIAATSAQAALPHPNQTLSFPLAEGDEGVAQTMAQIRRLVEEGKKDEVVRNAAVEMVRRAGAFGYDKRRQCRAIFEAVRRRIGFVADPTDKELLRPARSILEVGAGDCDEINGILMPALLESIGIQTQLVTIAAHPAAPDQFTHVYCEANVDGQWLPLDAARRGARWGRRPGKGFRVREWSLSSNEFRDRPVMGLGSYGAAPVTGAGSTYGSWAWYQAKQPPLAPGYHVPGVRRPTAVAPRTVTLPRRPRGLGAARVIRHRRLPVSVSGLGAFNWTTFANILNAGTSSALQIIGAVKSPTGQNMFLPASGTQAPAVQPAKDYTPLLLIGGGLALLMIARKG